MASKVLQGIGVLALAGLVLGSVAALVVVSRRIRVSIADEEQAARRGPDPIETLSADVAALREELRALREELAAEREQLAPGAPPDPPSAADPVSSSNAEARAATPKKSFLSFERPAATLAFDQPQRFAVIASLSRVGFDARSTLHDFSGVSSKVEGELHANLARAAEGPGGTIRAEAAALDTGNAQRDADMRGLLEVQKYPQLSFEWTSFESTRVDAAAHTLAGVARGQLTIHGLTRELAMPVEVKLDAGQRLAIDGQTRVRLSEFGIQPPSKLGLITVEDELVLWIALRARSLGRAAEKKP